MCEPYVSPLSYPVYKLLHDEPLAMGVDPLALAGAATSDDPRDPFDFSPAKYLDQLVAGVSKTTRARGLIVTMPDASRLAKGESRTSQ